MSNRYITEGIINDLHAGKHVLLVGPNRACARNTFLNVVHGLESTYEDTRELAKITRAEGRERIAMHDGGKLTVATLNGVRGLTADAVVLLEWEQITGDDFDALQGILPVLYATNGELVQA